MVEIHGIARPEWESVVEAFGRNFELSAELGAACCVYQDGQPVVDVWAGIADRHTSRPWERETSAVTMSTTKGATAICAHILAQRGDLDLDAPVGEYWPELAAGGKPEIRVRWLLSHQAGLPVVDAPLTLEEACAWDPVISALEHQEPLWLPGTQQAYHALTFGFLVGEVIRRVTGRTVGTFFANEVAKPLGLGAWIGLPAEYEPRVARLDVVPASGDQAKDFERFQHMIDGMLAVAAESAGVPVPPDAREALLARFIEPESIVIRSLELGGAFPDGLATEDGGHNLRLVRASEQPSTGLITDARSLARMYAATVGHVDDIRLLDPSTLETMCEVPQVPGYRFPAELGFMTGAAPFPRFSYGFMRPSPAWPLISPASFGHAGAGGSLGFADPARRVGFGYVMNHLADDRNARRLVTAVANCLR